MFMEKQASVKNKYKGFIFRRLQNELRIPHSVKQIFLFVAIRNSFDLKIATALKEGPSRVCSV